MIWSWLDERPLMVCIAGPNGAGKTTFYHTHIAQAGLVLVNADTLSRELGVDAYEAANVATHIREELVRQRESFAFETVFSDPVGDKVRFLEETAASGYVVALCFVGLGSARLSEERVMMRVAQGGHGVPKEKIKDRFARTLANLKSATKELPHVVILDNSDLTRPYQQLMVLEHGKIKSRFSRLPSWIRKALK